MTTCLMTMTKKQIKKILEDVLPDTSIGQNDVLCEDFPKHWPEKVNIGLRVSSNLNVENAARKIKKYPRIRQKGHLNKVNKKAAKWLKKLVS